MFVFLTDSGVSLSFCAEGQWPAREEKERLPAQPEPMKCALASQRTNLFGWCMKCWQQTVNNRNHWQVDDVWSTAGMFVTFPENWHSNSRAQWSIRSSYLRSWRYCNFADWFWKKPEFSIVLWGKARFEPKYSAAQIYPNYAYAYYTHIYHYAHIRAYLGTYVSLCYLFP